MKKYNYIVLRVLNDLHDEQDLLRLCYLEDMREIARKFMKLEGQIVVDIYNQSLHELREEVIHRRVNIEDDDLEAVLRKTVIKNLVGHLRKTYIPYVIRQQQKIREAKG